QIVEVRPPRQLHVLDLAQDRVRLGALAQAERSDLRAFAGDIAGRHDARERELWYQADPDRAQRRQVGPEAPGEQHLGDVARLDAELAQEDVPAGRDRRLGELQLADVALGEEHRRLGITRAVPV